MVGADKQESLFSSEISLYPHKKKQPGRRSFLDAFLRPLLLLLEDMHQTRIARRNAVKTGRPIQQDPSCYILHRLSPEILIRIFEDLDMFDLFRLCGTCRAIRNIVETEWHMKAISVDPVWLRYFFFRYSISGRLNVDWFGAAHLPPHIRHPGLDCCRWAIRSDDPGFRRDDRLDVIDAKLHGWNSLIRAMRSKSRSRRIVAQLKWWCFGPGA